MELSSKAKKLIHLFSALSDPSRFQIFSLLLRKQNICVSDLGGLLGLTTSAASQHLKILEQSGLTLRERHGQKICYKVNSTDPLIKCLIDILQN